MGKFLDSLKCLEVWFDRQKRVLPWRSDPAPYRVWVSEIMLQQTQVITVVPYFERFMVRFPSVEELASAREEDVLLMWSGLGYYSRARYLHEGAKAIVKQGRFPKNREEWQEIPGVGPYTAGAILSIAYNQPEAILDGNVERVLSRVRRVSRQKGDSVFKSRLWRLSWAFVSRGKSQGVPPSVLNQALMEVGATICVPKKPRCELCPLIPLCQAHAVGEEESYPPKKKPKEWLSVKEKLHCVLSGSGQILLQQRKAGEWRAGLWDLLEDPPVGMGFPGGMGSETHGIEYLGTIETKYVVTRHRVQRTTEVWRVPKKRLANLPGKLSGKASNPVKGKKPVMPPLPIKEGHLVGAAEPFLEFIEESSEGSNETNLKWVPIRDPGVAVGSALRKALREVEEKFSGQF